MADALSEAMQGDLATKNDLVAVRSDLVAVRRDLTSEIGNVRAALRETELRLDAKIEATTTDLIEWVVGMIGFQTIVLLGAALALARVFTS